VIGKLTVAPWTETGILSWLGSTRAEANGSVFVIETMTETPAEKLVHAVDCSFVDEVGWPFN
jgi:hypothetical protein